MDPKIAPCAAARALALALSLGVCSVASAQNAEALRAGYQERKDALASSAFKRPMTLEAKVSAGVSAGHVHALIGYRFNDVAAALRRGVHWCDVFNLQTNVKRCVVEDRADATTVRVSVVRRFDQAVSEAFEVAFVLRATTTTDDFLSIQLAADSGPLSTRDYRLSFEATPLDGKRTLVHMAYSYTSGMAARLATEAYLASAGRDKVGFTVTGRDETGAPRYVDGIQGVAERNTMRYYLAIEALLHSLGLPLPEQAEAHMRNFHAAIEKHPRQLHEMSAEDYFSMKRREGGARQAPAR